MIARCASWWASHAVVLVGLGVALPLRAPAPGPSASVATSRGTVMPEPACAALPIWSAGVEIGTGCEADLRAEGFTLVDVSDEHVPRVLAAEPAGEPAYAVTFRALAAERADDGRPPERFLELWGIAPTFGVVADRLDDAERAACHAAIDDVALAGTGDAIARDERTPAAARDRPGRRAAIRAAEAHLACDGALAAALADERYDAATDAALTELRRRDARLGPPAIDDATRALLAMDPAELDFRAALRALRERVVAATGLLEDGSARGAPGLVLGRALDAPEAAAPPSAAGAPDLIAAATEAAARALGWTSPDAARRGIAALRARGAARVAVRLPPPPRYHAPAMALRAEIDRGRRGVRPTLTLFAIDPHDGSEIALVRWPTTVGGWQRERLASGAIVARFKRSPSGDYVWRDVIAGPVWFAPPTTPDRELVRWTAGRPSPREDTIGPGHRSAYGLAMIMRRRVDGRDSGIRTHGTVDVRSVLVGGVSHGCHRLTTTRALRLTGFLLAHRAYAARGELREPYRRTVAAGARRFVIRRETRGFLRELEPPVPVRVR